MGNHALLSPSGASRWLACTPSARFEEQFPESESIFAEEGTMAHKIGELLLQEKLKIITKKQLKKELAAIEAEEERKVEEAEKKGLSYTPHFNDTMLDYCEEYASYIMEILADAQTRTKDAMIFLEQELDLTDYIPESFGTSDAVIVDDYWLNTSDLKYGKGVAVSVEENKQQMVYALGALAKLEHMFDIRMIRMHIYQPRISNISTWEISVEDLKAWAETELKPKAAIAFKGEGDFLPGDHCQFCRGKARCRALAERNLEIAQYHYQDPNVLTDEEISDILSRQDLIEKWLTAVDKYALDEAVNNGKKWPGYKLVAGRSNRTYTDQDKVADTLTGAGFSAENIYKPQKLLGITAMEKEISKKKFKELLEDKGLIIKPTGKPTLAPLADKRPEFNSLDRVTEHFDEPASAE